MAGETNCATGRPERVGVGRVGMEDRGQDADRKGREIQPETDQAGRVELDGGAMSRIPYGETVVLARLVVSSLGLLVVRPKNPQRKRGEKEKSEERHVIRSTRTASPIGGSCDLRSFSTNVESGGKGTKNRSRSSCSLC